ncbi:MAG: hypothetical protein WEA29_07115 [Acidimicrobiia bacterium]
MVALTARSAIVALLLAACAGSPQVSPISSTPFDEIRIPQFTGPGALDPGPEMGGRALKDEVFADGMVTFDEYERAMNAYAQCVRDEGFEVDGPFVQSPQVGYALSPGEDPRNLLIVSFPGIDSEPKRARNSEVDLRCQEQWSFAIETVWREQNAATGAELEAWLERAWECARQRGTLLSDPPTLDEAMRSANAGFVGDGCVPWE